MLSRHHQIARCTGQHKRTKRAPRSAFILLGRGGHCSQCVLRRRQWKVTPLLLVLLSTAHRRRLPEGILWCTAPHHHVDLMVLMMRLIGSGERHHKRSLHGFYIRRRRQEEVPRCCCCS